MTVRG